MAHNLNSTPLDQKALAEAKPNARGKSRRSQSAAESGMNKGERLWMVFTLSTVPIFLYMFLALRHFHQELEKRDMEVYPFSDFKFCIAAACAFYFIKNFWERVSYPLICPLISEKHVGAERANRTKRVIKWIFDFFYFTSFTTFGYYHFRSFLPMCLGGPSNCDLNFLDHPYPRQTKWVREYYLLQMSHLFFKIFDQIIKKRKDVKFWEYFLHHFLSFVMVIHSYTSHFTRAGTITLLALDLTDIFLSSLRAQEALKYQIKYFFPIYYGLTLAMWIYIRGLVYPLCIVRTAWELFFLDIYPPRARICDAFFAIMTTFLAVMNFYWIFALAQVGVRSAKTKSYANVYDPVLLKNSAKEIEGEDAKKKN